MTEITDASTKTKKKRGLFLPIAAVIIAIAVIGFIASRAGLDKALVKQQLDAFIVDLKERGRAQGRDLDFTYVDLEVVGSFASKHVVIMKPQLIVKPLNRPVPKPGETSPIDALVVTTPSIEIYPESADLSSMKIQLPEPLNFAGEDKPEKSLLKITSNVPPVIIVSEKKEGEVVYNEVTYQAPPQTELVYLREEQAKGEEEKTPTLVPVYETLNLAVAQGSGLSSSVAADNSGLGNAKIFFRDLVLTPKAAPQGALKVAEITGEWGNNLNEKKLNVVHAQLKAGPVTSDDKTAPYLPVELNAEVTYEGAMPKTPEAIASIQAPESSIVLKNFSLTSKEASLKAVADFKANASDMLPVGTANITLTNVAYVMGELRKYGLLTQQNEPLINAVLAQVTGTPVDQLKDVVIPVERARGGAFKIGQTTFEELFAVFLKQAMQMRNGGQPVVVPDATQPLAPTLPPADKPKSAPIEVPDHGVRG